MKILTFDKFIGALEDELGFLSSFYDLIASDLKSNSSSGNSFWVKVGFSTFTSAIFSYLGCDMELGGDSGLSLAPSSILGSGCTKGAKLKSIIGEIGLLLDYCRVSWMRDGPDRSMFQSSSEKTIANLF